MDMQPVSSSNIAAIGYEADTQTLGVRFNNGTTWHYEEVPQEVFDELSGAESVGRTFNQLVKGSYNGSAQ